MVKLMMEEIVRQAYETRNRPLWKLPASWWDEKAIANMAEWVKANNATVSR